MLRQRVREGGFQEKLAPSEERPSSNARTVQANPTAGWRETGLKSFRRVMIRIVVGRTGHQEFRG